MNDEPYPIDLGPSEAYAAFPAEVSVDGAPYWLVLGSGGEYRLLLAVCPHAGGDIRPHGNVFYCPLHFWTFHGETGICLNDPGHRLLSREVVARDNRLYAAADPR